MRAVLRDAGQLAAATLTVALFAMLVDLAVYEGRGMIALRLSARRRAEAAIVVDTVPTPSPAEISAVQTEARRICEEAANA